MLNPTPMIVSLRLLLVCCVAVVAVALTTDVSHAQAERVYVRASGNYQLQTNVALFDNLPPGAWTWFGYGGGVPDQGDSFVLPGQAGGGLAVGYRVMSSLRVELAVDHSASSTIRFPYPSALDSEATAQFTVSGTQFMGNAYFDLAPFLSSGALGGIEPYLLGGVGVSLNRNGDYECSALANCTASSYANANTQSGFAWQVGVGLMRKLTSTVAIDVGYRYADLGSIRGTDVYEPNPSSGLNGKLRGQRMTAGVVYSFGSR
jgi:opacity protein-like surface antigen